MDLTHRFSVPASVEEAWRAFNNLEALAPCFPGATITNIDGDDFSGSVKIKLGPIALVYNGSGTYAERDGDARRVVIEARGKDKRGNGTATATVTASFHENGDQTDVEVVTDLAITGKPAQFGRGVISDISDKLLDQFVNCVSGRFTEGLGEEPPAEDQADDFAESASEQTIELGAVPEETDGDASDVGEDPPAQRPAEPIQPAGPPKFTPPRDLSQPDFDVFATIGPVLLKRFGPALAVIAILAFAVIKIIKRNR